MSLVVFFLWMPALIRIFYYGHRRKGIRQCLPDNAFGMQFVLIKLKLNEIKITLRLMHHTTQI